MSGFNLGDYVDVKERLQEFYKQFPNGSIQFEYRGVMEHNQLYIWGVAYAYRTPDDPRPGIGTAAELAEGKTTYTRGSELMNLETSAWGRAIGALGIGLGKSVATRQEVEAAKARQEPETDAWGLPVEPQPLPDKPSAGGQYAQPEMTDKQYNLIKSLFGYSFQEMTTYVDEFKARFGLEPAEKLSSFYASKLIEELKAAGYTTKRKNNYDPESKYN
jgi:hypothetical protein